MLSSKPSSAGASFLVKWCGLPSALAGPSDQRSPSLPSLPVYQLRVPHSAPFQAFSKKPTPSSPQHAGPVGERRSFHPSLLHSPWKREVGDDQRYSHASGERFLKGGGAGGGAGGGPAGGAGGDGGGSG